MKYIASIYRAGTASGMRKMLRLTICICRYNNSHQIEAWFSQKFFEILPCAPHWQSAKPRFYSRV